MKAGHGHTKKHAGGTKHAGSLKHQPTIAQLEARLKLHQKLNAHELHLLHMAHIHAVATPNKHPKPAKWSPHEDLAACAIEALAASLRPTGRTVTDADVAELYGRVTDDPDAGMRIDQAIEAAAVYGLAGVRLLDARPAPCLADGVVLGVDLAERHALTAEGHGVWTWGEWRPASCGLLAAVDEAWELTWAGAVA
jgi:hypothetical protein